MPFAARPIPIALVLSTLLSGTPTRAGSYAVYRSTDQGLSWTRADDGLPSTARVHAFAATGEILLAGTDSGVFRTTDRGLHWHRAATRAPGPQRILALASTRERVLAGTDGDGLRSSTDQGQTWAPIPGSPSGKIRCLLSTGDSVLAGTEDSGVLGSTDGGLRWSRLGPGLPDGAQVFALAEVDGIVFAGLYSRGLFAWIPGEHRWERRGTVTPLALAAAGTNLVAGHNPGGLFWSHDLGTNWSRSAPAMTPIHPFASADTLSPDAPVWEMTAHGPLVVAGVAGGVYRSTDAGRTWDHTRGGLPDGRPGIAFLASDDLLLAALAEGPDWGRPTSPATP